jgi:NADPH:quinone reductase-like Zn-dependent oxidoreductase
MRLHLLCIMALLAAANGVTGSAAEVALSEPTMRAALVSAGRIQIRDVARPVARPGQVLVKIRYASVNPDDWNSAGATAAAASGAPIPGFDGAGVIAALGAGVTRYHIGDAVIIWSQAQGTYAQYVAVPADTIALKPDGLSFAKAAGVAHAGLAAWNLLIDVAKVHKGLASNRGALVIATASARDAGYLKTLGAKRVIDYSAQHFEDQLRNIDIALDTVDIDNAYRALAVIRRGGYLLSTIGLPSAAQCAAAGVICSGRAPPGTPVHAALMQLADWSRSDAFKVNVERSFALTQVLQAWLYSQAGDTRGKAVIRISD